MAPGDCAGLDPGAKSSEPGYARHLILSLVATQRLSAWEGGGEVITNVPLYYDGTAVTRACAVCFPWRAAAGPRPYTQLSPRGRERLFVDVADNDEVVLVFTQNITGMTLIGRSFFGRAALRKALPRARITSVAIGKADDAAMRWVCEQLGGIRLLSEAAVHATDR